MRDRIAPVSVIIPTWKRLDHLKETLQKLDACDPAPAEIIVHVDAGDTQTVPWLRENRSDVRVLTSNQQVGPGGGRNRLMATVQQPYVASLDDDSYPLEKDYFDRLVKLFDEHSRAAVLVATVIHRGEEIPPLNDHAYQVADFIGCGCAYRTAAWHETAGYVPLPLAYGMEEADLSLQLLDRGWKVIRDHRLRVFHDTDLSHHEDPKKTAASIANRALLAYIRYPMGYLPWGIGQYLNRIRWSVGEGRTEGIDRGLRRTPELLWQFRRLRAPVSHETLRIHRKLRSDHQKL